MAYNPAKLPGDERNSVSTPYASRGDTGAAVSSQDSNYGNRYSRYPANHVNIGYGTGNNTAYSGSGVYESSLPRNNVRDSNEDKALYASSVDKSNGATASTRSRTFVTTGSPVLTYHYDYGTSSGDYGEDGLYEQVYINPETSIEVRRDFVKKVLAIIICQLTITFSICAIPALNKDAARYVLTNGNFLLYIFLAVFMSGFISICCFPRWMREFPINYAILGIFSVALGGIMMFLTATAEGYVFLLAVGTTLLITLILVLFASQTRFDFTGWGSYLMVFLLIAIIFSIFGVFVANKTWDLVVSCMMTILFSVYIVYDTQLIFGGKCKKYQFGVDDYAFAALSLYLDIVNLFLRLFRIVRTLDG